MTWWGEKRLFFSINENISCNFYNQSFWNFYTHSHTNLVQDPMVRFAIYQTLLNVSFYTLEMAVLKVFWCMNGLGI